MHVIAAPVCNMFIYQEMAETAHSSLCHYQSPCIIICTERIFDAG